MSSYPNSHPPNTPRLVLFDFREPSAAGELEHLYAEHAGDIDIHDLDDVVIALAPGVEVAA